MMRLDHLFGCGGAFRALRVSVGHSADVAKRAVWTRARRGGCALREIKRVRSEKK